MNVIQYLLGQFGSREKRQKAVHLLLELNELPGNDWVVVAERAWRSGLVGRRTDISRRARAAGTFTALRRFKTEDPYRGLFVQSMVLASHEDAAAAVPQLQSTFVMHPDAEIVTEGDSDGISDSRVRDLWAREILLRRKSSPPSSQKLAAGSVGRVAFVLSATGFGDGWPWAEVAPLVSLQVTRISRVIDELDERLP